MTLSRHLSWCILTALLAYCSHTLCMEENIISLCNLLWLRGGRGGWVREQWGAVWVDWPEPLFLFNVFKSFCAVASQREQPFHLLHRHVSNSMKNDSYTGCEVAPASSVPYILRRSSTACRTVFCFWCVSTFTVKQWWSYLSNTFFFFAPMTSNPLCHFLCMSWGLQWVIV